MIVVNSNNRKQGAIGRREGADVRLRRILIVGGGTAGWMAAAGLSKALAPMGIDIRLVESGLIGPIGVGEATVPPIMDFIRQLGIDEDDFIREIKATFKLGIGYRDWTRPGDFYFHPFGPAGAGLGPVSFPSYWLKKHLEGGAGRLEEFSVQAMAAVHGKFARPVHAPGTPLNKLAYALHFDASLFACYLRTFAQARGVARTEGTVREVSLSPQSGFIESVTLDSGEILEADLFIDCSGFRAVLLGKALGVRFEDWTKWLPCDRAAVVQSAGDGAMPPYTLVTAREAGWQWRIPLQHRVGNGHVYSSGFMNDEAAREVLLANLPGARLTEPVLIDFTPGRRTEAWRRNCVALGLSSGFMEPLEATSIHMIQRGIAMLLKFFPNRNFERADIERYNRTIEFEFSRIRDFLLLHYSQTSREGPFWEYCRSIPLTDSLREKIELFCSYGRILREETELFPIQSWLSVMIGQGVKPRGYDPLTDGLDLTDIEARLDAIRVSVRQCVDEMPLHQDFIRENCAAAV